MGRHFQEISRKSLVGILVCLIIVGWVVFLIVQSNLSPNPQQNDIFGEVYIPFAQHSPEELDRALRSMPPPKPAPLLSIEKSQKYLPYKLVLAQCPSFMTLEGVQLTKEIFPDGTMGRIFSHVIYRFQAKPVILKETPISAGDNLVKPERAKEIMINNGTAWLLENWVPERTEIWWEDDGLRLALSVDKTISTQDLIKMANCVQ